MILRGLSEAAEDRETLTQVEGLLKPLQIELSTGEVNFFVSRLICRSFPDRVASIQSLPRNSTNVRARRQAALDKMQELKKNVENWDTKDVGQCCNEFVRGESLLTFFLLLILFKVSEIC